MNSTGEMNPITLPGQWDGWQYRQHGRWSTSDARTWIAPQLYAPPSFVAYRAKRDPALEAILGYGRER